MEPDYFDLDAEERMWPTTEEYLDRDWIDDLNHMDDRDYDQEWEEENETDTVED